MHTEPEIQADGRILQVLVDLKDFASWLEDEDFARVIAPHHTDWKRYSKHKAVITFQADHEQELFTILDAASIETKFI